MANVAVNSSNAYDLHLPRSKLGPISSAMNKISSVKWFWNSTNSHLDSARFTVTIEPIMTSILTVGHHISGHPLVGDLASLGSDHGDLNHPSDVDSYPLVVVVVSGRPSSHVAATADVIESATVRPVIFVPTWWSWDLLVLNTSTLYSKGFVSKS